MFAIVKDNQIVKFIQPNTVFVVDWVEYPADWIANASQQSKDAIGLVDVVYGNRNDERFYWVTQDDPVYNASSNVVEINYTNTPKDLDSVKSVMISQTNQSAYTILLPSDWMVVKALEIGGSVPANWTTWRQTIRTEAADYCAAINACSSMEQLEQLPALQWARSPNDPAPVVAEQTSEA